jgi:hypothetical protein
VSGRDIPGGEKLSSPIPLPKEDQTRFLKHQLSLPISTMSQ